MFKKKDVSSFAAYLLRPAVLAKLKTNITRHIIEGAIGSDAPSKMSRIFNSLNYPPSPETTYENSHRLLDKLDENTINFNLEMWSNEVLQHALNDLFDENGNFDKDIYDILNQKQGGGNGAIDLLFEKYENDELVKRYILCAYLVSIVYGEASELVSAINVNLAGVKVENEVSALDKSWIVIDSDDLKMNLNHNAVAESELVSKFLMHSNEQVKNIMAQPSIRVIRERLHEDFDASAKNKPPV